MACRRAWGLSAFYADLNQGNRGGSNISCPAVLSSEERWPRTKCSCAVAVLCDMPKDGAVMMLRTQRVRGMGKRKAQSLLSTLTNPRAPNVC